MRKKFSQENINKVIEYFKKTDSWIDEFENKYPETSINSDKLGIDHRDFSKLCVFYNGYTDSKEDFLETSKKLYDKIVNNKEQFLDEYFNEYEKIDYNSLKYDTFDNAFNSLTITRLSQFNSTALSHNPDYRKKRYEKDIDSMIKYDQLVALNTYCCSADTILVGKDSKINFNDYDNEYRELPFSESSLESYQSLYSFASIMDYNKGLNDYVIYELPDFAYYGDKVNGRMNNKEIPNKYNDLANSDILVSNIVRAFNPYDGYSKEFVQDSPVNESKMIYVNGTSLYDLCKDSKDYDIYGKTLTKAIKDGKAIDVVSNYKDKNNVVNTKIYPLSFKASKETMKKLDNEYFSTKHSWFRLTFFNWGPFKIKEKGLFADKEKDNLVNKSERYSKILESSNNRILEFAKENNKDLIPGKLINNDLELNNTSKKIINLNIDDKEIENENNITNNKEIDFTIDISKTQDEKDLSV